jgi:tRNA (adenine37-N6)-methyltransferase
MVLKPIGVVRSPIKELTDDCWGGVAATIALDAQLFGPEGTQGLDQFSHVEVIFLLNKIPAESVEKGARHPRGRTDWPKMGIFAQRSKDRPNRIGITICKLLFVKGLEIRVSELRRCGRHTGAGCKTLSQRLCPARRSTRTGLG